MKRKLLLIVVFAITFKCNVFAQMLAVNTDVLMDACMAYSAGIELTLANKGTLNLNGIYGNKIVGKEVKVLAFQPEWRYYISGRPMHKQYVGCVALLTNYDYILRSKRNDGNAAGVGISWGYVLPLSKRALLDFHTSIGFLAYRQKEYFVGDNYDKYYVNKEGYPIPNSTGFRIMPMRMGISVSYILNNIKK